MNFDLFQGKAICLAPLDLDRDPEVISRWSHDSIYLRMLDPALALPLSTPQVKKMLEEMEKEADESGRLFHFTIRSLEDDHLIGTARIAWIDWSGGAGQVQIGIGSNADRGRGYGQEALSLILQFAFDEMNLFRLWALVPGYNDGALRFFHRAGFVDDVRFREALHRAGQRWDLLLLGLLSDEWRLLNKKL
jgi:RimJ/RimL family protein N-acetyltransferase